MRCGNGHQKLGAIRRSNHDLAILQSLHHVRGVHAANQHAFSLAKQICAVTIYQGGVGGVHDIDDARSGKQRVFRDHVGGDLVYLAAVIIRIFFRNARDNHARNVRELLAGRSHG